MNLLIKAKTKPSAIRENKPQRYHGHTTIELKNIRTGSRERIESDNEFTLGIDDFLLGSGFANNAPFNNSDWRAQNVYRRLIGGIFLFDKEIEKVDNVLPTTMPAGTKMIANGSHGVVNNANPTELGSFNSNESSFNANALTYVYDWTTSQGNGTIECVSLTSDTGGYIGYGNGTSQQKLSSTKNLFEYQPFTNIVSNDYASTIVGEYVYYIKGKSVGDTFTIYRKLNGLSKASLFHGFEEFVETVEVPANISRNDTRAIYGMENGKFVCTPISGLISGNVTFGVYDVATKLWAIYSAVIPSTSGGSTYDFTATENGISNSNYTAYGALFFDDTTNYVRTHFGDTMICIADDLYMGTNGLMYDRVNDTIYPTNGRVDNTRSFSYERLARNRFYSNGRVYRNPLYLATINNLDEPVTKTAQQTMKVTYTVTPA